MQNEIIGTMTNLGDSGQDKFAEYWTEYAKLEAYEQGVSKKFLNSTEAQFFLGKCVTDLVEDGKLSTDAMNMIKTLRTNHPHSEDL